MSPVAHVRAPQIAGAMGPHGGGPGKPYATVVVAAADSIAEGAADADFVGDGIDDVPTFEAALQFVLDNGGYGRILFLEGKYVFATQWGNGNWPDKADQAITIEGQGHGSVIEQAKSSGGAAMSLANMYSVAVKNLTFRNVGGATGLGVPDAISTFNIDDLVISNCRFENIDNYIDASTIHVFASHFSGAGSWQLYLDGSFKGIIADSVFMLTSSSGGSGVELHGSDNIIIANNVFTEMQSSAVKDGTGSGSSNIKVIGNSFVRCGLSGQEVIDVGGDDFEIKDNAFVDSGGPICNRSSLVTGMVFMNNVVTFDSTALSGSSFDCVNIEASNSVAQGNVIIGPTTGNRYQYIFVATSSCWITNNDFVNANATTGNILGSPSTAPGNLL